MRNWAGPSGSATFTRASRDSGRAALRATGALSRKPFRES